MPTLEQKIDDLATSVKAGFDGADKRFEKLEISVKSGFDAVDKRFETLPDKSYLDDKIADLKGDLIVKLRKEDAKVEFLIDLLRERNVLTITDAERLKREFEVFPRLM